MALATSVQFTHGARTQPLGVRSGDQDPSTFLLTSPLLRTQFSIFYWPPILNRAHICSSEMCFMFSLKIRLFQDFRFNYIHQNERCGVRNSKNCLGRGSPPPQCPSPALSRALPSIRAWALDSGFARFWPPYFWRVMAPLPCWRDLQLFMSNIRWMKAQKICVQTQDFAKNHLYDKNKIPIS